MTSESALAKPSQIKFKVVVAGPFAAGKTTFIQHISQTPVVGTEAPTSGAEAAVKATTTVGVEYGTYVIGDTDQSVELLLFGVPGQARFQFMWDIVSAGIDALLVVIDATDQSSWDDARDVALYLVQQHSCPVVFALNRASARPEALELARDHIGIADAIFTPCEVVDRRQSRDVMVTVLAAVLEDLERVGAGGHGVAARSELTGENHG